MADLKELIEEAELEVKNYGFLSASKAVPLFSEIRFRLASLVPEKETPESGAFAAMNEHFEELSRQYEREQPTPEVTGEVRGWTDGYVEEIEFPDGSAFDRLVEKPYRTGVWCEWDECKISLDWRARNRTRPMTPAELAAAVESWKKGQGAA